MGKKLYFIACLPILVFCLFSQGMAVAQQPGNDFRILDVGERGFENGQSIAILFSKELKNDRQHDHFIRITDGNRNIKSAWVLSDDRRILYFPHVEPETEYTVTILEGITSENGIPLGKRVSKTVTTRAMESVVSFKGNGLVLPEKTVSGLPVVTVNIKSVDIEFFKMNPEGLVKFVDWRSPTGFEQCYRLEEIDKYAKLVYSGRFDLDPEKNKRITRYIPVKEMESMQEPGVYLAVMRKPGEYEYQYQSTYFIVTDIGLQARVYPHETRIYSVALASGKIIPHAALTFYDNKGHIVQRGATDERGAYTFPAMVMEKTAIVIAKSGNHVAALPFAVPAVDLSEFNLGKRVSRNLEVFAYGPRNLYRPGETVVIASLLRDGDGQVVPKVPLSVRLIRPDGLAVRDVIVQPLKITADLPGYYFTEFSIPSNSQTGNWRAEFRTSPKSKTPAGRFDFHVEAFLPETMKLDLASPQTHLGPESNFQVDVTGLYLYGAPASKNRISARVIIRALREPFDSFKGFEFGNIEDKNYKDSFELEKSDLDEKGNRTLLVKKRWKNLKSPMSVRAVVSLYESGGRPVVRSIERIFRPSENLVGVEPQFSTKSIEPGLLKFNIIKAAPDGSLLPVTGLIATVIKEDRDYFWEYSNGSGWNYNYTEKNYIFDTQTIKLLGKEPTEFAIRLPYGRYLLKIKDPRTSLITSLRFRVGYWSDDHGKDATARPDMVRLDLDKEAYQPGDVIKLMVKPPHKGNALIMVESDKPLWSAMASVEPSGTIIEIPVSTLWKTHDIYISATVLRPGNALEKITPNRAMGLVHLPLDRKDRKISLSIEAPEKILPSKRTTVGLSIDNRIILNEGPLFVTLAAVDMGILNITNFKTPDPFAWFFSQRRFDVDIYDMYNKVIEAGQGKLARIRYGGGADLAAGGKRPETQVKLLSLFNGPVMFDKAGKASVDLDLPDFNGGIRLMAVAFGKNTLGSAEREITVAAPLVSELSMPRFLSPKDETEFVLDLKNMSGGKLDFELEIGAQPPVNLSENSLSLTLDDQEKKILTFPVTVGGGVGASTVTLHIEGEGIDVNRTWTIGVRPAYPATAVKIRKILERGETFGLNAMDLSPMIPSTIGIDLKISPSFAINMNDALQGLINYPYGCVEQTLSRAFPFVFLNPQSLTDPDGLQITHEKRDLWLKQAIEKLQGMQLSSGGFGLWNRQSPEDAWLTVYAADFLLCAKQAGVGVPAAMLTKTLARVETYLQESIPVPPYGNGSDRYDFSVRSYGAYLLSLVKKVPLGTLRLLYDHHRKDAHSPLSLVQLGHALNIMGDRDRSRAAFREALTQEFDETQFTADYSSALRDYALSLAILFKNTPDSSVGVRMISKLEEELAKKSWFSTQERYALLRAGTVLMASDQTTWSGNLTLWDKTTTISHEGALVLDPLKQTAMDDFEFKFQSGFDDKLFVSAVINGYSNEQPPMDEEFFTMKRSLYDLDGNVIEGNRFKVGEMILVHIQVEAKRRVPDALVVDLYPAGFEGVNLNLTKGVTLESLSIEGKPVLDLMGRTVFRHEEYLDDRYVAAVELEKGVRSNLFYLVRVVSPGKFSVPQTFVESMYTPHIRGVGRIVVPIEIENISWSAERKTN